MSNRLDEIKARHNGTVATFNDPPDQPRLDVEWLIAEVERLEAELADERSGQWIAYNAVLEDENERLFNFNELEGPRLVDEGMERAAKIADDFGSPMKSLGSQYTEASHRIAAAIRAEAGSTTR